MKYFVLLHFVQIHLTKQVFSIWDVSAIIQV